MLQRRVGHPWSSDKASNPGRQSGPNRPMNTNSTNLPCLVVSGYSSYVEFQRQVAHRIITVHTPVRRSECRIRHGTLTISELICHQSGERNVFEATWPHDATDSVRSIISQTFLDKRVTSMASWRETTPTLVQFGLWAEQVRREQWNFSSGRRSMVCYRLRATIDSRWTHDGMFPRYSWNIWNILLGTYPGVRVRENGTLFVTLFTQLIVIVVVVLFIRRRTRRLQPVHLSPAAGVRRHGTCADVHAVWFGNQREGLHRPCDQPEQVLRSVHNGQ